MHIGNITNHDLEFWNWKMFFLSRRQSGNAVTVPLNQPGTNISISKIH